MNRILLLLCVTLIYNQIPTSFAKDPRGLEKQFYQRIDDQIQRLISSCHEKTKISENSPEIKKFRTCARAQLPGVLSLAQETKELLRKDEDLMNSDEAWVKLVPKICKPVSGIIKCLDPLKNTLTKCYGEKVVELLELEAKLCKNGGEKILEFMEGIRCFAENVKVFEKCFKASNLTQDLIKLDIHDQEAVNKTRCRIMTVLEDCTSETLSKCSNRKLKKDFEAFMEEWRDESSLLRACKPKTKPNANYRMAKNVGHDDNNGNGGANLTNRPILTNFILILLGIAQVQ